jgi:hypothetical protein
VSEKEIECANEEVSWLATEEMSGLSECASEEVRIFT